MGCGRIGARHATHINELASLVAVCDIEGSNADALAAQYNCKSYHSLENLLTSDLDFEIVAICTPNGLHAAHSIQSLQSGRHVLCEKPMATSVADCGEMIKVAEKVNKRLFVVKQNRFNPPVKELKKLIVQGRLGEIHNVHMSCFWNRNFQYYENNWKGTKELDGGTLFTQFSHFIDLLYWLIGDVDEVRAFSQNYCHKEIIEFEDTGVVILKFHSGAVGTINYTVNSYKQNMEGSLTVFGSKGTVKIGGQYLNTLEYQSIEGFEVRNLPQGNQPNDYGHYQGSMSNHELVYKNLIDVMTNNAAISTSGFEGLKTVEIISKIYKAIDG